MMPLTPTDLVFAAAIAFALGTLAGMALLNWTERAVLRS